MFNNSEVLAFFSSSHRSTAIQTALAEIVYMFWRIFKLPFALNWKPQGITGKDETDDRDFRRVATSKTTLKDFSAQKWLHTTYHAKGL